MLPNDARLIKAMADAMMEIAIARIFEFKKTGLIPADAKEREAEEIITVINLWLTERKTK